MSKRKKQRNNLSLRTKLFFCVGILLLIIPICFYFNEAVQLSFFTPHVLPTTRSIQQNAVPVQIQIPSVQMTLSISETALSGNVWEIASQGISHLAISARPGEKGAIILYGHNTNDRFGPIRWLQAGEKIIITTQDKKNHSYQITKTLEVNPSETTIFNQKEETLILYTCDGFADLKRFVVIAKPA